MHFMQVGCENGDGSRDLRVTSPKGHWSEFCNCFGTGAGTI